MSKRNEKSNTNEEAKELLKEMFEYLNRSDKEAIHSTSIFHRQMKEVLIMDDLTKTDELETHTTTAGQTDFALLCSQTSLDRKGTFKISIQRLEDAPQTTAEIFSRLAFIPMRVECLYMSNEIECSGVSPLFKPVPHGQVIPYYSISVDTDKNGNVTNVTVA